MDMGWTQPAGRSCFHTYECRVPEALSNLGPWIPPAADLLWALLWASITDLVGPMAACVDGSGFYEAWGVGGHPGVLRRGPKAAGAGEQSGDR